MFRFVFLCMISLFVASGSADAAWPDIPVEKGDAAPLIQVQVQSTAKEPKAAPHVYLFRGFLGIFSTGMDTLSEKLKARGYRTRVMAHGSSGVAVRQIIEEHKRRKGRYRVVLVGHSFGANAALAAAARLAEHKVRVELVITYDPTRPGPISGNVRRYINIYQSENGHGRALIVPDGKFRRRVKNINLRDREDIDNREVGHFNMEEHDTLHAEMIREIRRVVRPR